MTKQITIDPVTRIEGHAKITIRLDDAGDVENAILHVTQFRGFEKFCEGRPFHEMPAITARICGICPVSHLLASSKACDALMAVQVPETGKNLRRLLNVAQIVQSHALNFFHLSSPDLLMGMDSDPKTRNVMGLIAADPALARKGIRLRQFGQHAIELMSGKRIHTAWVVPGGVNKAMTPEVREEILAGIPEAMSIAKEAIDLLKGLLDKHRAEIETFANFPSCFMGLVQPDGTLDHYDGQIRLVDENRNVIEQIDPSRYADIVGEAVEPWSYLKFPYYKARGYPDGIYRVGPLARLNVADRCGTPEADKALQDFRALGDGGAVLSSFHYHFARLVEIVNGIERMEELLSDPSILDTRVRAHAAPNATEGVGVTEAPRGTLIHHYKCDEHGLINWVNLIVATGHNNLAMNRGVTQVAKRFVKGDKIEQGALNRVEAVIRAFDPCLSCSTHALGTMPLHVGLVAADGTLLDEARRD